MKIDNFIYTDSTSANLCDKFWCAYVSHHHYWFESYEDLMDFMDGDLYDSRMKTSSPAKSSY